MLTWVQFTSAFPPRPLPNRKNNASLLFAIWVMPISMRWVDYELEAQLLYLQIVGYEKFREI